MPSKPGEKKIQALTLDMAQVTRTKSVLNANQVQKIFNSTPTRYKYQRPARGGGQWTYVRASYVRRVLDSVFGFNWNFEIHTDVAEALDVALKTGSVVLRGTITAKVDNDGTYALLSRTDFGRAEVKFKKGTKEPLDFGNDVKAATSDCMKRCAARFGIAADVYEPEEFLELEIAESDPATPRAKRTDKLIKEAEKQIAAKAKEVDE